MNGPKGRNKSLLLKFKATVAGFTAYLPCSCPSPRGRGGFLFTVSRAGPEKGYLGQGAHPQLRGLGPRVTAQQRWRGFRSRPLGLGKAIRAPQGGVLLNPHPRKVGEGTRGRGAGELAGIFLSSGRVGPW